MYMLFCPITQFFISLDNWQVDADFVPVFREKSFFHQHFSIFQHYTVIDGQTPRRIGYRELNETSVVFTVVMDHATNERLPESNLLEVFSAELWRFKRIIASMGISASDGEDVLQDVSIKALKRYYL